MTKNTCCGGDEQSELSSGCEGCGGGCGHSKEEMIAELSAYLEDLKQEMQAVEEHLQALKG